MFELVVASGKGGTGKTSLVGALAKVAGSAVLVDCDVDAANLHLIVPHHVLEEHDFIGGRRAAVDMNQCIACGFCLDACRFDAIEMTSDPRSQWGMRVHIDPLKCEGCGLCVRLCEVSAITFDPVISGRWFLSESDHGPFLHARLGTAQSNSGRLVTLLRQRSREIAETTGQELIVVDGPPGIGCPVIASLTNASYLLIVTEPSMSAIHDMERLADLAAHFDIRTGVCINKWDISEELSLQLEEVAARRGLALHGRIPFDPAFTEAQLRGRTYLQTARPEGIARIKRIWRGVTADSGYQDRSDSRRFAV